MRFSIAVATVASAAVVAAQTNHLITVGAGGLLAFNPNNIQAAQGDTVTFEFQSKNHSATQSTFTDPCQLAPGGVNSGFQFVPNGTTQFAQWQITVNNASTPLWFFCAQTNPEVHCQKGMVFSINANAVKTFEAYQTNANTSTLSFTDPDPAASSAAAAAATSGAVVAAPSGAATDSSGAAATSPGVAGATGASGAATSLGSIPSGAVPSPAANFTPSGNAPAAGNTSAPSTAGNGAIKTGLSLGGVLGVAGLVTILL